MKKMGVKRLTWLGLDCISGHQYCHVSIPFWNAFVRFGFFVVVAVLLKRFKGALDMQVSLAQIHGLTGFMNARTFKQRCSTHFLLVSRNVRTLALGSLDLDSFIGLNDNNP